MQICKFNYKTRQVCANIFCFLWALRSLALFSRGIAVGKLCFAEATRLTFDKLCFAEAMRIAFGKPMASEGKRGLWRPKESEAYGDRWVLPEQRSLHEQL
jgi:hypothetical protein